MVFSPLEFQHQKKGDDRAFAGFVNGKFPLLVVADGASDTQSGDQLVSGGGEAAHQVTLAAVAQLINIKEGLSPLELQDIVRGVFDQARHRLSVANIKSGTTLLVALPYIHTLPDGRSRAMWHYGYIGDGDIQLVSKERRIDGRAITTALLSPQKWDSTASITHQGTSVNPFVGSCDYTPGDCLFMTTDGLDGPRIQLRDTKKTSISFMLGNDPRAPAAVLGDIAQMFRGLRFSDDAVLACMTTEVLDK